VHKLMAAPAVQFKGSGWYVTDYSGKGKEAKKSAEATEARKSTEATEGTKATEKSSDGAAKETKVTESPKKDPKGA
jgi:predicted nucleic acid-binding Zn ribbon protein